MWLVWTGGDDRFWDRLTIFSAPATLDLLKIITSHPSQTYCDGQHCDRDSRWRWLGSGKRTLLRKAERPRSERGPGLGPPRGLANCPAGSVRGRNEVSRRQNWRARNDVQGRFHTPGRLLFRLRHRYHGARVFSPNPDFDQAAEDKWDPERYYTDSNYYTDPDFWSGPIRVGMSCGFCHVGPSPIHPPKDPTHPKWEELNSTVGAQYLSMDRVFAYTGDVKNFVYQLLHSYPPGTTDTSLVSTDYINNPRNMNAIYLLGPRLAEAKLWGKETVKGGQLLTKQLPGFFDPPDTSWSPRLLNDGSNSLGILAALTRVYINIGLYSEEWTQHFNPFFGGEPVTPFPIATAEKNSAYWRATNAGTPLMAKFLVAAGKPDSLAKAPGGEKYLTAEAATLDRGRTVFAETCARCHSSKLPDDARAQLQPGGCSGPDYLKCFSRYWAYTKTDEFKAQMRDIVAAPDFLKDNYLSTDARIPVTLLRTNACSPLGTNVIRGNIWDNFSSETYKNLPSVGKVTVQDPFTAERWQFQMPGGGVGFTRVPSLVSVWSTAPFLLNNRLGPFSDDPSVDGRMKVFGDSIEQLLWPEKRQREPGFDGYIVRTTERSFVAIPKRSVPVELKELIGSLPAQPFSKLFDRDDNFSLGPIPKGFPINLVASYQPNVDIPFGKRIGHDFAFSELVLDLARAWPSFDRNGDDASALAFISTFRQPILRLLTCPDFVVNRGHYFGTAQFNSTDGLSNDEEAWGPEAPLSDDDKRALIELVKTF